MHKVLIPSEHLDLSEHLDAAGQRHEIPSFSGASRIKILTLSI